MAVNGQSRESLDEQIPILLQDYLQARQDGRNHWVMTIALTTAGFALLGGVVALQGQQSIPPDVWLLVPFASLALTALLVQQVAIHTFRAVYERALEEQLQATAGTTVTLRFDGEARNVISPSLSSLIWRLFFPEMKTGWLSSIRLLSFATLGGLVLINGAILTLMTIRVFPSWDELHPLSRVVAALLVLFVLIVAMAALRSANSGHLAKLVLGRRPSPFVGDAEAKVEEPGKLKGPP